MLGKKMEEALNKQINAEMYSAFLYLAMSADFEKKVMKGFANWMKVQYEEEMEHAFKFYNHILERGGTVKLEKIDAPKQEWKSAVEAFEDAYGHEQKVTAMINNLLEIARAEKDYPAESMLKWFIDEQVEEEAQTSEILELCKMTEGSTGALFAVDHRLAKRKED